jgi:hypothetical protein
VSGSRDVLVNVVEMCGVDSDCRIIMVSDAVEWWILDGDNTSG